MPRLCSNHRAVLPPHRRVLTHNRTAAWGLTFVLAAHVGGQDVACEVSPFPALAFSKRVQAVVETADARLFCGLQNRVHGHGSGGTFEIEWQGDLAKPGDRYVRCLTASPDGSLWIGTAGGLWLVPPGGTTAQQLPTVGSNVWCVAVDAAGVAWACSRSGLQRASPAGAVQDVPLPIDKLEGDTESIAGIAVHRDRVYLWSRRSLWWRDANASTRGWIAATDRLTDLRVVASSGDDAIVVSGSGLHRLNELNQLEPLWRGDDLAGAKQAVRCGDAYWIASDDELWTLTDSDPQLRRVRLFERGSRLAQRTAINAMYVDRQGVLWIGTDGGAYRILTVPGIQNVVIGDENEHCAAMTELANGGVVYAQADGSIHEQQTVGWRRLNVPWETASSAEARIECLGTDRSGALWAGTRRAGVWVRRDETWQRVDVGAELEGARCWLQTVDGTVWLATPDRIWCMDERGAWRAIDILSPSPSRRCQPSALVEAPDRSVWLGTFSNGLYRSKATTNALEHVVLERGERSVLEIVPCADRTSAMWVVTTHGLQLLTEDAAKMTTLRPRWPWGMIRSAAPTGDGALWLVYPHELVRYDPDAERALVLPPRLGGHPLEHSYASALNRRNGEIWIGVRGGYTRVVDSAHVQPGWPLHYLGSNLATSTGIMRLTPGGTAVVTTRDSSVSLMVSPDVIDRCDDRQPPIQFVLRDLNQDRSLRSENGAFEQLPRGRYELTLVFTRPTGDVQVFHGGLLKIERDLSPWPWLAILACILGATGLLWNRRRLRHGPTPRQVLVEQMLTKHGGLADQILDIAFLAVATAERCGQLTSARHTSVWLKDRSEAHRILLAEFGGACPDAERRADCCCAGLDQDALVVVAVDDGSDVLVRIKDAGELQFEILLHETAPCDDDALRRVREATLPLSMAIRKLDLLDRLEAEKARSAMALAADLHDLRNPLTTLRLCSHDLVHHAGGFDSRARELSRAVATATDQIIATVEQMTRRQRRSIVVTTRRVDPWTVVAERLAGIGPIANAKRIRLDPSPPAGTCEVELDVLWFGRAIDNIVGNAIKYSPRGTAVRVLGEITGGRFRLHVIDQGPGFRPSEIDAVFLPGVVGSARPTGGEEQSGIGMWIARQAIRAMDGELRIEPTPTGCGAHVSLDLPTRGGEPNR